MPKPTIEVLGVYALPTSRELLKEQTDILYGTELAGDARQKAEQACREQLESTVLIEALVRNRDKKFDAGDFAQPRAGESRENWQVAWNETYLSLDGSKRLDANWPRPPEEKDFRVAFFIHYWNPHNPLVSSYGELILPPVQQMPDRLQRLAPYEPVD